ncbi:MAG: hypothetical protein HFH15_03455 [Ruminococcus sp.]|nr:hypothetical protein [Ruminococcus sp.]
MFLKGAMVLNLVIKENNPSRVERMTREIDFSLDVQVNRIFGERKSAGFKIINENREKIASIDLSVRENHFCRSYISYVNGVSIKGANLSKMLSDKYTQFREEMCVEGQKMFWIFM